jgi:peptide deformylase
MAILKVGRIGHPIIRAVAQPIERAALRKPPLQRLIDDMVETMHEYEGVGLAAPQVHVGLRLAVIEVPSSDEDGRDAVPLTVLVNPQITPLDEELVMGFEGCLSIPDLRGEVPRLRRVRLEALDRDGKPFAVEASEFHARVIQHECDHLDGRVYLDRMRDMRSLSFMNEFERHVLPHENDDEEPGA